MEYFFLHLGQIYGKLLGKITNRMGAYGEGRSSSLVAANPLHFLRCWFQTNPRPKSKLPKNYWLTNLTKNKKLTNVDSGTGMFPESQ